MTELIRTEREHARQAAVSLLRTPLERPYLPAVTVRGNSLIE
jgi:hypothetical protein